MPQKGLPILLLPGQLVIIGFEDAEYSQQNHDAWILAYYYSTVYQYAIYSNPAMGQYYSEISNM